MVNRFQSSAKRIIDGNFGTLKKPLVIVQSDGYDYLNQESDPIIIINTDALKRSLSKSELESQNVQIGDFALIFTDETQIDVDRHSCIYNGIDVDIISVLSLPADAAQTFIVRVK